MDNTKTLDVVFANYGGAFEFELGQKMGLHNMRRELQRFSSSILCDYINNSQFNAVAKLQGDKEYIGIFYGFTFFVYYIFLTMMSDPKFLPEIGDVSLESLSDRRIRLLKNSTDPEAALVCTAWPKCPVRRSAADHMIYIAHLFLYFHEAAHLEFCHLYLVRDEFQSDVYEEIEAFPLSDEEADVRQVLELQADQGGALTSLREWRAAWQHGPVAVKHSLDEDLLWSASVEILLILFQYIRIANNKKLSPSHPNPFIRWLNVKMSTSIYAEETGLKNVNSPIPLGKRISEWFSKTLLDGAPMYSDVERKNAKLELYHIWERIGPYRDKLRQYQLRRGHVYYYPGEIRT
ncbi:hypothetical protein [Rhodopseudomonas palustris]|uniref:hypothetical protein n=1 Tax=Rhodopseudomonas palustris TaxID=1076 RepID=UPI0010582843|nr:hypothetical protein [Rhodopseudomonas palustris]